MAAGKLRARVQFENLSAGTSNGMGSRPGTWTQLGEPRHVQITPSPGAETVLAGRLANKDPAEFELRRNPETVKINAGDRAREIGGLNRLWNIKSVRLAKRPGYLAMTVESGGAGS